MDAASFTGPEPPLHKDVGAPEESKRRYRELWHVRHTQRGPVGRCRKLPGCAAEGRARSVDEVLITIRLLEALSRFDETPQETFIDLTPDGYVALGSEAVALAEAREALLEQLPSLPNEARTQKELLSASRLSRSTVQRSLEELVSDKLAERIGEGKKTDPYRWLLARMPSAHLGDTARAESIWTASVETPADAANAPGTPAASEATIGSAHVETLTGAGRNDTFDQELAERATDDDGEAWP